MTKALTFLLIFFFSFLSFGQHQRDMSFKFSITPEMQEAFGGTGKLMVYLTLKNDIQPVRLSANQDSTWVFGLQVKNWKKDELLEIDANTNWTSTANWTLNNIPYQDYYLQVSWDESKIEQRAEDPYSMVTQVLKLTNEKPQEVSVAFSEGVSKSTLVEHDLIKKFSLESSVLSKWWGKSISIHAAVLIPSGYADNPTKKYPVCYSIGGYGSRYTRVNQIVQNSTMQTWWTSKEAPQIITVFLDGYGQYGDSYQLDSENNGPYGTALIEEIIPEIEKKFRTEGTPESRYTAGCSTGGWVSLALQLYYPDHFGGCFSYSADPVSFYKMQLINIYKDKNAFYNDNSIERPSKRNTMGEPEFTIKKEVRTENVEGYTNSYITSRNQWGGWNAVYSPRDKKGFPMPIFDPITGAIDPVVAEHWKNYDLLKYTEENWSELGPKIQGKIHIWMGDMDNYYLNNAMRDFDSYLMSTTNPKSDAEILFSPTSGHCDSFSIRTYLEAIQKQMITKPKRY
jgi:enterochelin esterase-like enzyme